MLQRESGTSGDQGRKKNPSGDIPLLKQSSVPEPSKFWERGLAGKESNKRERGTARSDRHLGGKSSRGGTLFGAVQEKRKTGQNQK